MLYQLYQNFLELNQSQTPSIYIILKHKSIGQCQVTNYGQLAVEIYQILCYPHSSNPKFYRKKYFIMVSKIIYSISQSSAFVFTLNLYPTPTTLYPIIYFHLPPLILSPHLPLAPPLSYAVARKRTL